MSPFVTDIEDFDDPDDEQLEQTPQYVIERLGFDPLALGPDNGAQDANLLTADPTDTPASMMRKAVQSELDAIELYEKMAALTKNEAVRRRLLDVAREEKTHVGEFESILLELDKEQAAELAKGAEEVAKDS